MEKYLNAVLYDHQVSTMKKFFPVQCKSECSENNFNFGYGNEYLIKCFQICENKHQEYLNTYTQVKETLEKQINHCMETINYDDSNKNKLKECILANQQQAMRKLLVAIEKLDPELELDY